MMRSTRPNLSLHEICRKAMRKLTSGLLHLRSNSSTKLLPSFNLDTQRSSLSLTITKGAHVGLPAGESAADQIDSLCFSNIRPITVHISRSRLDVESSTRSNNQKSDPHPSSVHQQRLQHCPSLLKFGLVENSPTSAINAPTAGLKSVNSQDVSSMDRPALEALTASLEIKSKVWSRIGKISNLYYDQVTSISQAYKRALLSHIDHDQRFGYSHFVLRRGIVEGLWTKHAWILHILVKELAKSPAERLEWVFWHDVDVVIVNN